MVALSRGTALSASPPPLLPRRRRPDTSKDAPKGAAVTVLKAAKFCFSNIVEVSGCDPREETAIRRSGRPSRSREIWPMPAIP